jgi:hypothetical protein
MHCLLRKMTAMFLHFIHNLILISSRSILLLMRMVMLWRPTTIHPKIWIILTYYIHTISSISKWDILLLTKWVLVIVDWCIRMTTFTVRLLLLENRWHKAIATNSWEFIRRCHWSNWHGGVMSIVIMTLIIISWYWRLC